MHRTDKPTPARLKCSLTPDSVRIQLRQGVIRVLGLCSGSSGRFSDLEEKLIQGIERVVRRGESPSFLADESDLCEALSVLIAHFGHLRSGTAPVVFHQWLHCAQEAARAAQNMAAQRSTATQCDRMDLREEAEDILDQERRTLQKCLAQFQEAFHSDVLRHSAEEPRRLTLQGEVCTLDALIQQSNLGALPKHQDTDTMTVQGAHALQSRPAPVDIEQPRYYGFNI